VRLSRNEEGGRVTAACLQDGFENRFNATGRTSQNFRLGRSSPFRARSGMTAITLTPVLPEATTVRAQSAQLRHPLSGTKRLI
jgi:hypothetical protein